MRTIKLVLVLLLTAGAVTAKNGTPVFSLDAQKMPLNLRHETSADGICCYGGAIYLGSGGPNGSISKLSADGRTVLWSYPGSTYQPSYPVSNGKVVVYGTYYGPTEIICLDDSSGTKLWSVPTGQCVMSAATFSEDRVFIGSYDKYLYAIDWSTGRLCWKTPLAGRIWCKPAVDGDRVIVGDYAGYLYSLDRSTGEVRSKIDCEGVIEGGVTVAKGMAFVCAGAVALGRPNSNGRTDDLKLAETRKSRLLVVDLKSGKVIDEFKADPKCSFSANVAIEGPRAFFYSAKKLYCYSLPHRKLLWWFKSPLYQQPAPVFHGGMVVLPMNQVGIEGQHETKLCVLDPLSGKLLSEQETGGIPLAFGEPYQQYDDMIVTGGLGVRFYWFRGVGKPFSQYRRTSPCRQEGFVTTLAAENNWPVWYNADRGVRDVRNNPCPLRRQSHRAGRTS